MTSSHALDILAFAPHPDDAEIFCGGLLALSVQRGYRVGIVDLSRGERSSRGTLESRGLETERASKIIGLHHRENIDLPDGSIYLDHREEHLQKVVAVIRRLTPTLLLLPYWEERHPDHRRSSELITDAAFFAGVKGYSEPSGSNPHQTRQLLYYQLRVAFTPSFITDIAFVAEQKMKAVRCYESQFGLTSDSKKAGTQTQEYQTLLSSSLSLFSVEARDHYYGSMVGSTHGEPYLAKNILPVSDPMKLFAEKGSRDALLFPEHS